MFITQPFNSSEKKGMTLLPQRNSKLERAHDRELLQEAER